MRPTIVFFLFAASLAARPAISPGGVTNIASRAPDGLPNSGIAQGSIFMVSGTGLGTDNPNSPSLFQTTTYPLPTIGQGLNGTTIEVRIGRIVNAIMLYESPTMLAAILPSNTPTGSGTVTVVYNGQSSIEVAPIHVVSRAFGVFPLSQLNAGGPTPGPAQGPALIQNVSAAGDLSFNTITNSAKPGQTVLLYGTGLGAVSGDESKGPAQSNVIGLNALNFQIWVGNKVGVFDPSSDYIGRYVVSGTAWAGVDVVEFQVPNDVQGCYVPVALVTEGISSNIGSMSIDPDGSHCSDAALGYSQDDLQQVVTDQAARIGTVTLTRLDFSATGPDGSTQMARSDGATGNFVSMNPQQFHSAPGAPSPGGCSVITFNGTTPPPSVGTTGMPLDAGPGINLYGPNGALSIAQSADMTSYGVAFDAPFLDAGGYALDNGDGGADVGPFSGTLNLPAAPQWLNADSIRTVAKDQPLRIFWSGGDPDGVVSIVGAAIDPNLKIGALFTCTANTADGQFTVPSYVLTWLPNNTLPIGLLLVTAMGQNRFQAPGLEVGYFNYTVGVGKNVQYNPRPTNVKQ